MATSVQSSWSRMRWMWRASKFAPQVQDQLAQNAQELKGLNQGLSPSAPPVQDMPVSPMPDVPSGNGGMVNDDPRSFQRPPMYGGGGMWGNLQNAMRSQMSVPQGQFNRPPGFNELPQNRGGGGMGRALGSMGGMMAGGMGGPSQVRPQPPMRAQPNINPMNQQRMGLGPRPAMMNRGQGAGTR